MLKHEFLIQLSLYAWRSNFDIITILLYYLNREILQINLQKTKDNFHNFIIGLFRSWFRSSKSDNKNDELIKVEKQVDKYKDVLDKIHKKFSPSAGSEQDREKRIKKIHEYRLAQSLEESFKDLPEELILNKVIKRCGKI